MELKVRIFVDGTLVEPSEYKSIIIANPSVDKIVNDVYEKNKEDTVTPVA